MCKDTLQNIYKLRGIIKRKGTHNISHKPERKLHWKKILYIPIVGNKLLELHAM